MFNFMFQNSGAKILAKIVFVLFVSTRIPNSDCIERFYSLPCPKSIAEKIKSWTNTFLSDFAEQAFLFLSQDTETSPWCFSMLFKDVSSRKPVKFCLVENISLLFLFLNKIIWKQGEQRPWLQRSWGLTLRTWRQNFLQDLLQSLWVKSLLRTVLSHQWHTEPLRSSKQQTRCVIKSCKGSICAQNIKTILLGRFYWQRILSPFWGQ